MKTEQILDIAPLVLSQAEREAYFDDGFLVLDGYVDVQWRARLRAVVAEKIEASRSRQSSDDEFDLAPDHRPDAPRIRRLRRAVDYHPALWEFATAPPVVDLVADLLGPDVRFHSSKLNFKSADGGEPVRWHQDIQAWPHTSFSVLTLGVYLEDVASAQGPLAVVPGSHTGELFEQFSDNGNWSGYINESDLAHVALDTAIDACGCAGTVVLLHCRVVHGSAPNHSSRSRPLLLNVYSSADSMAFTPAPTPTRYTGHLVRGCEPRHLHMEPYTACLPPRWDQVGYGSIFTAQGDDS